MIVRQERGGEERGERRGEERREESSTDNLPTHCDSLHSHSDRDSMPACIIIIIRSIVVLFYRIEGIVENI